MSGDVDPKTFTVGKFEIITGKLADERRHIVRIRSMRTGEAMWRLQQLRSEDERA
jgi:hypothetical protein